MKLVHLTRWFVPLTALLTLTGCLSSDSSGSDDTHTGRLNYHGLSGITYTTNSQTGETNAAGEFRYYPGETLSLKVGNLPIIENVPADRFVSFLDFQPELREALRIPAVNSLGLKDHRQVERDLITSNTELSNRTRFLLALTWAGNTNDGKGIDIRPRVIEQLNAALASPNLPDMLDFTVSPEVFAASDSPANQILRRICFHPADDRLCGEPPTQQEIDNAEPRPEDDDDLEPGKRYKEDLESLRDQIAAAVRTLADVDREQASAYLRRELNSISNDYGRKYALDPYLASHPASDTAIKTVKVTKINGQPELAEIEAISTRPADVQAHSWSWQDAGVEYFVAGEAGGEAELLINFRPSDTYRWITKPIRVLID
ncbi:MAG TPA: organic solvent ABC transporter permease [Marinobacter sp.]|nr:organic solvent ABC transporter permease [Marinobacter sp.]